MSEDLTVNVDGDDTHLKQSVSTKEDLEMLVRILSQLLGVDPSVASTDSDSSRELDARLEDALDRLDDRIDDLYESIETRLDDHAAFIDDLQEEVAALNQADASTQDPQSADDETGGEGRDGDADEAGETGDTVDDEAGDESGVVELPIVKDRFQELDDDRRIDLIESKLRELQPVSTTELANEIFEAKVTSGTTRYFWVNQALREEIPTESEVDGGSVKYRLVSEAGTGKR